MTSKWRQANSVTLRSTEVSVSTEERLCLVNVTVPYLIEIQHIISHTQAFTVSGIVLVRCKLKFRKMHFVFILKTLNLKIYLLQGK